MKNDNQTSLRADLRTAQNRMFEFVKNRMRNHTHKGTVAHLLENPQDARKLYQEVQQQLFRLLNIDNKYHHNWHMGVADSGKRAIETLVSYFCPSEAGANIAVNTENYVAFNKFSAASALKTQKGVDFEKPFDLAMGQALTIGSASEMEKAKKLLLSNKTKTLWIAWNSTSTGIEERVEDLVAFRNSSGSNCLIISDAASLPLFSTSWQSLPPENLPDVFFFSLRKQGIPYDGPQDEANQARNSGGLIIFNDRALKRSKMLQGPVLYDSPRPENLADFTITTGEQRPNHLKHLLKLQCCLETFLEKDTERLVEQDQTRKKISEIIATAFGSQGQLKEQGFKLVADSRAQSETAFIVQVPPPASPKEILAKLKERGVEVSLSMHPELPGNSYFRFACYPATSLDEATIALTSFNECLQPDELSPQ